MIAIVVAVLLCAFAAWFGFGLARASSGEMPPPPERCTCGSWHPQIPAPPSMPPDPFKKGPER